MVYLLFLLICSICFFAFLRVLSDLCGVNFLLRTNTETYNLMGASLHRWEVQQNCRTR